MNTKSILDKIHSRGYWKVIIKPKTFVNDRISDISSLFPLIDKANVRMRGWDFPHIDPRDPPIIGIDWIEEQVDWLHAKSCWRFYQSGLFIYESGIGYDWRDESSFWPPDEGWKPGKFIGVGDIVHTFTEIMEFASRLVLTEAGDEEMHFNIELSNIQDRMLYVDNPNKWPFHTEYKSSIQVFPYKLEVLRTELIATKRDLALIAALEVFKRFHWNTSVELLRGWQDKIGKW